MEEGIRVVIFDEDKALRLIWYLPTSYEHMKPILMYGKDMVIYSKVTTKLLSEERRLSSEKNALAAENALVVKEGKSNMLDVWTIWAHQEKVSKRWSWLGKWLRLPN